MGEVGTMGALAALGNAVADALRPAGVAPPPMPYTPERLWKALNGG